MKTWLILGAVYIGFFFWYTDMGGKLSQEEIQIFIKKHEQNIINDGVSPDSEEFQLRIDFLKKFMEEDNGKQFIMVNNIEMNKNPGDVVGANPGESADQLMSRYMEYMWPNLLKRASHPIFMSNAVYQSMDLVGIEGAETWDQAALMRYKSRRTMMEIVTNPNMMNRHDFKIAALQKTIAYPVEPFGFYSDMRLIFGMLIAIVGLSIRLFLTSKR
ncbi:MAG: hypothetical protein P8I23_03680 [SAR86 cluster bacterium]|jgi:hypothetical protein|nr:hypothetical protein [SAR86 cluster bacterium]MDG1229702.1 hypothetical protein [SAR86 cluster bacterium]MDG1681144.1 hypothetical protein [SAR86 cluster bacterium]|tara:strand:- start:2052 stop:2696 length:645 start_codon:yes stop_codon:yes gene_type:complete